TSTAPANRKISARENPGAGVTLTTRNLPSVSVPVLSTTNAVTRLSDSNASAVRNRIPSRAPRPVPTTTAIGVASPNAHGQATMTPATASATASGHRGDGPTTPQIRSVASEISSTAGTNQALTASANR